jgi:outer membrane protein assembly factor BamB
MWGKPSRRQVLSAVGTTVGWATVSGRVRGQQPPDGLVCAASETGELVAFSAATGERRWSYEFSNDPELIAEKGGPPLIWNGTVYLGAQRQLHAVDAATGEREWVFEGDYGAMWPPTVYDGTVYLVNNLGLRTKLLEEGDLERLEAVPGLPTELPLYALDAETGEREWRTDSPVLSGTCQAPLVYDGTVFVLGSHVVGGTVSAYDTETGTQRWAKVSTYGDLPLRYPQYGPVEMDGLVYIMGAQGGLRGFDPDTGDPVGGGGMNGTLRAMPHTASRGKLSAYGSTLLSADGSRLDRFLPETEGEESVPGRAQGSYFPFDRIGELEGVKSSFAVGPPIGGRHPYLLVGAQRWESGVDAAPGGDARFQATSMNPAIFDPDPEWTYEQPTLVNPTAAGRTAFIGGAELTALDLRDGTERWSSGAFEGRIVTAPTVAANPEHGHSVDERIRHQTLNHHDALGPRPASFRVGGGRLSAAGLGPEDQYIFPDDRIEPRTGTDDEPRDDGIAYSTYDKLVGRTDANGRITISRDDLEKFRDKHGDPAGLVVEIHNVGGKASEKPVKVNTGEFTSETTVPIQGYGVGSLYLFENRAAVPGPATLDVEANSAKTYFSGAAFVDFPGKQLLPDEPTELTVSTPDHERTIRFEGAASSDTPEQAEFSDGTGPSTERPEQVDSREQDTTGGSGPGFGVVAGLTATAAGVYARYVSRKRPDER